MENHGLGTRNDNICDDSLTGNTPNASQLLRPFCPNWPIIWGIFEIFITFFRSMSQLASLHLATKPFQLHWSFQLKGPDALIRQNQQCAPSIILCILQCARLKTSKFCWLPARNTLDFGMKHPDLWEKVCLFVCFYPLWQYWGFVRFPLEGYKIKQIFGQI